MSEIKFTERNIIATDGTPLRLLYDQDADMLEIFFGQNVPATGITLTDHIVLRIDQNSKRAISLLLLHFSILTEQTEYGPRNFVLEKLTDLPNDLRALVLQIILSSPVNEFLKLSQLHSPKRKSIPLTYVEARPLAIAA